MDLLQLKMPPEQATLVADAIERDIEQHPNSAESAELTKTLVWLRYRIQRWKNNHHDTSAD